MKIDLFIELNGKQTDSAVLIDMAKETWKSEGNKVKDIQTLQLYFKPDEGRCYFVINEDCTGHFVIDNE